MRAITIILLATFAVGCVSTAQPKLEVHRFGIGNGGGHEVSFNGSTLVVTEDGEPNRVVWTRTLTDAERGFLSERINEVRFARIKDEYDSGAWDGSAIVFTIQQSGAPRHIISVQNDFVEELADLCDAVDVLLPLEYRFRWRAWKAERDGDAGAG